MKFTPRPYQDIIIKHILSHPRCAVWAGMGLGKTVATLAAVQARYNRGAGPTLVLAPLRVAQSTWPVEMRKWDFCTLTCEVLTGPAKKRAAALRRGIENNTAVFCMNYDNVPWLVDELKKLGVAWPFDTVVADESTRLKGVRFRGGGKRAYALYTAAKDSRYFIELTGTPAPNGLSDLWGQFFFLDNGDRLGRSFTHYHERFFRPVRVGSDAWAVRWEPLPGAQEKIHELVSDLVVRLNPEEWFTVDQPIRSTIPVYLPESAKDLYAQFEEDMYAELGDGTQIEASNAGVKTSKCLQVASGALYVTDGAYRHIHDAKIEALGSVIEEAAGAPVLVSYLFRHEADRILKAFPKARMLDKNPKTITEWNAGRIPILVAHPASCGHGLNLQDGGNILCFFGTGWNLEEHEQIVERIGPARQKQAGHPRPVFVYYIVAEDTLDETVQKRLVSKREVLDLLMERRRVA